MINMISKLLGGDVIGGVTNLVQGFTGDKKAREEGQHQETMGLMQAYANELLPRYDRTWWDSLVDGINRLIRPTFTVGVLFLFIYCFVDPAGFSVAMQALTLMPDYGWALLATVVAFWFGGRFLSKDSRKVKPLDPAAVAAVIKAKDEHEEAQAKRKQTDNMEAMRRKLRREQDGG